MFDAQIREQIMLDRKKEYIKEVMSVKPCKCTGRGQILLPIGTEIANRIQLGFTNNILLLAVLGRILYVMIN